MSKEFFASSNAKLRDNMQTVQTYWTDAVGRSFDPINQDIYALTAEINDCVDDAEKTLRAILTEYSNTKGDIDDSTSRLQSEIADLEG
ncbi:MAG: hypothetical protein FWD49_05455 [Firmicutes bacterium]|nr:hypothetical protein [Bacillota bacterium]